MTAADPFVPRRTTARGGSATDARRSASRPGPARPRGLLYSGLTTAVALAVVGGASYFAWTIYAGGGASAVAGDETVPVIVAALESYKTAPENPGGITAPGGDFAFYSEMEGRPLVVRPGEEHVLPPPEEPIAELVPELFDRPVPVSLPVDSSERRSEEAAATAGTAGGAAAGVIVPPVLSSPIQPLPTIDEGGLTPEPVALPTADPAATPVAEAVVRPQSASTVQLASMRSAALADQEVQRLRRLLPDLLANRQPIIRESASNGVTYFRVSFSTNGPIDAAALCSEIKTRALDCIVHN